VDQPDPTIHQPVRLRIMAALKALPRGERIEFVRLKAIVGATEGNLGAHIGTLESAGYVRVEKDFNGKKPRTRVSLAEPGRRAFRSYVEYLRTIVEAEGTAPAGASSDDG
jgi:DNA-binding transcriptional ArsR family regulator